MHILLSNDDGYLAEGLAALADALRPYATLSVVAPDRNRSGASNSLTLEMPLRIHTADNGFIKVDGTPTDCVHLAITGLLADEPDMAKAITTSCSNMLASTRRSSPWRLSVSFSPKSRCRRMTFTWTRS